MVSGGHEEELATMVFGGLAAGMLAGCTTVEPPCFLIRHDGPCVLRVEYGDGSEASEIRRGGSTVWWFHGKREVVRVVLLNGEGKELCRADGEAFAERYRQAPGRGGADYALRLSADGVEWMTREGFTREAQEVRDARQAEGEEADRRKDWLTRELDARWREGRQ